MKNIKEILKYSELKNYEENFELIKYISSIVDTSDARKVIIHILDIWENVNNNAKEMWIDLIGRAGFYPYYIEKVCQEEQLTLSFQDQIKTEFFKSDHLPIYIFINSKRK